MRPRSPCTTQARRVACGWLQGPQATSAPSLSARGRNTLISNPAYLHDFSPFILGKRVTSGRAANKRMASPRLGLSTGQHLQQGVDMRWPWTEPPAPSLALVSGGCGDNMHFRPIPRSAPTLPEPSKHAPHVPQARRAPSSCSLCQRASRTARPPHPFTAWPGSWSPMPLGSLSTNQSKVGPWDESRWEYVTVCGLRLLGYFCQRTPSAHHASCYCPNSFC